MPDVRVIVTLIRAELSEHRFVFLYLPGLITLVFAAILLLMTSFVQFDMITTPESSVEAQEDSIVIIQGDTSSLMEIFGDQLYNLSLQSEAYRETFMMKLLNGISTIPMSTLWVVALIYLLDCLYRDRKDRSILFWKSMPVSDATTVGVKLLIGVVIAPLIYAVLTLAMHLMLLVIATLNAISEPIDLWQTLWAPAHVLLRFVQIIGLILFSLIWCLPFYAWLMLVSARVKSSPLAWAVGIPVVIIIVEKLFTGQGMVGDFMVHHIVPFRYNFSFDYVRESIMELGFALVLGIGLLYITILQRANADEI